MIYPENQFILPTVNLHFLHIINVVWNIFKQPPESNETEA